MYYLIKKGLEERSPKTNFDLSLRSRWFSRLVVPEVTILRGELIRLLSQFTVRKAVLLERVVAASANRGNDGVLQASSLGL